MSYVYVKEFFEFLFGTVGRMLVGFGALTGFDAAGVLWGFTTPWFIDFLILGWAFWPVISGVSDYIYDWRRGRR